MSPSDAVPALPWPYVIALCASLGGAILAMWKRDQARETAAAARAEARAAADALTIEKLATRLSENTTALRAFAEAQK